MQWATDCRDAGARRWFCAPSELCEAAVRGRRQSRTLAPYAGTPEDLRPFSKFTRPITNSTRRRRNITGCRDARTVPASEVSEVPIGFLGPIQDHKDIGPGARHAPRRTTGRLMRPTRAAAIAESLSA